MGNSCHCIKNTDSLTELFTSSNKNKKTPSIDRYNTSDLYHENNNYTAQAEEVLAKLKKDVIVKAKATPTLSCNKESSVHNKFEDTNWSSVNAGTRSTNTKSFYEEPPALVQFSAKEDYLDYAMDLFEEVNKYKINSELFNHLKNKYPGIFYYLI